MTSFSATDVALEGFRITREDRRTTLTWAAVSLGVSIVAGVVSVMLGAEAKSAYEVMGRKDQVSMTDFWQALETLAPILILGFGTQCVMMTAVYRIVLRHADHGLGYLKFGIDELRLAALMLIRTVLGMLAIFVAVLAAGGIVAAASLLGEGPASLASIVVFLATLGGLGLIYVRLSLAPVITFSTQRLSVFDSWRITRGYAGKLSMAYILAFCCMFVVTVLAIVLFALLAAIVTGGNFEIVQRMFRPDETSIGTYFTVATVAYLAFASLMTAIYYPVMFAPGARAYQAIMGLDHTHYEEDDPRAQAPRG
jgi:hypothetical protein